MMEMNGEVLAQVRGQGGADHAEPPQGAECAVAGHGARPDDGAAGLATRPCRAGRGHPGQQQGRARSAPSARAATSAFCTRRGSTGNPELEDFFTEEYALNHLIHNYTKPYIAFMDGIVMGGGMGISQGASLRLVTERTKMAMPETAIGLFPDVGGGYFLSRCPGHVGEWLALTGDTIGAGDAIAFGLADGCLPLDAAGHRVGAPGRANLCRRRRGAGRCCCKINSC
jgi:hypothetical protein